MIVLRVQGLSVSFADRLILESVSFDVANGERVGVVGPNGSGKSSLLKVLQKLLNPRAGSLSIQIRGMGFM